MIIFEKMVLKTSDANQINELAVKQGMITLQQDGIQKVLAGITTTEEVLRVTRSLGRKMILFRKPEQGEFMEIDESRLIRFYKMSGSGNDFIIIDNRDLSFQIVDLPAFVRRVCQRKVSVGADGLFLIEPSTVADFKWQFFNSDGSVAEMCGNGSRCVARYAYHHGYCRQENVL